jgi:dolichol-phosphate mannosyltransferase
MPEPDAEPSSKKCLVVIPTYNEAENIVILLDRLLALPIAVDAIVVDDASPDGTADLAAKHAGYGKRVFVIKRPRRIGYASAVKEGFLWGSDKGYDICASMDADLSHDPRDVPSLIAAIDKGADLAIGSRYCGGIRIINWPLRRLLLSFFAGVYTRTLCGLPVSDPTSGFKAVTTRVIKAVDFSLCSADGYGFIVEFHFFVWRKGFRIVEVPIIYTDRRGGVSKMSRRIILESAWTVLKLAARRFFQPADRAEKAASAGA